MYSNKSIKKIQKKSFKKFFIMNETLIKLCSRNSKYCEQLEEYNQLMKSLKTTESYQSFVNMETNDFYQNVW